MPRQSPRSRPAGDPGSQRVKDKSQPSDAAQTTAPAQSGRRKRPKQRPKSPLKFDDISQQLVEPQTRPDPKEPQKPRMPIVSALKNSPLLSSPHAAVSRKRGAGKCQQPRKKAKTTLTKKTPREFQQSTARLDTAGRGSDPSKPSASSKQQEEHKRAADQRNVAPRSDRHLPPSLVSLDPVVIISSEGDSDSPSSPAIDWVPPGDAASRAVPPDTNQRLYEAGGDEPLLAASFNDFNEAAARPERAGASRTVNAIHDEIPKNHTLKGAFVGRELLGRPDVKVEGSQTAGERGPKLTCTGPSPRKGSAVASKQEKLEKNHRPRGEGGHPSRKLTRNFSVSAQVSPLPVHPQAPPQVSWSSVSSKPEAQRSSANLEIEKRDAGGSSRRVQREWLAGDGINVTETRRPASHRDPLEEPLEAVSGHVHAQMLAILQESGTRPGKRSRRHDVAEDWRKDCRGKGDDFPADYGPSPSDGLSHQLHQLVDVST